MAIQASGTNGTAIRNRLAGMWVKTIVCSSPMRRARRAATHKEIAVKRLDGKNKAPREPGWSPKRVKNQQDARLCTISPVPKLSTVKSPARVKMRPREGSVNGFVHRASPLGSSTRQDRRL